MIDFIYHLNSYFGREKIRFCNDVRNVVMNVVTKCVNHLLSSGLQIPMHGVISSLKDAMSYDQRKVASSRSLLISKFV